MSVVLVAGLVGGCRTAERKKVNEAEFDVLSCVTTLYLRESIFILIDLTVDTNIFMYLRSILSPYTCPWNRR